MAGLRCGMDPKPKRKHWYKIDKYECPVCGRGEEFRTRMYTDRPEKPEDRVTWHEQYDWCTEWGGLSC